MQEVSINMNIADIIIPEGSANDSASETHVCCSLCLHPANLLDTQTMDDAHVGVRLPFLVGAEHSHINTNECFQLR
jgi:hypothetical protein